MRKLILPALFITSLRLAAQTTLSGNIGGMTLEQAGNPYFVNETSTIESGKTTTINPGCIFLFKPFTGIDVRGTLVVAGVPDTPIIFTSINDINYNKTSNQAPNPFDWNGITIGNEAEKVHFSSFMLAYSVHGIKSLQKGISIKNGIFLQNGQFNFTINGVMQQVPDNLPYSYNAGERSGNVSNKKTVRPLKVIAQCTGITSLSTVVGATVFYSKAINANREGNRATLPATIADARSRETTAVRRAGALYGTAAALLVATAVTYVLDRKLFSKQNEITVAPDINSDRVGVCMSWRF